MDPLHPVTKTKTPPHGVVLLAVRKLNISLPQYLGSDLHVSQGMEVTEWEVSVSGLRFRLDCGRKIAGQVDLCLPQQPKATRCDGKTVSWQQLREDVYRIPVAGVNGVVIEIEL